MADRSIFTTKRQPRTAEDAEYAEEKREQENKLG
jgi:hypothetical protein